ncbi:MAG: class I SAM-dependent methyltransferase [Cyclobacteriaceae bacterium]|nr:class I SAM-dependent methyltransferase [Cyclobacteriaceae bacterium]
MSNSSLHQIKSFVNHWLDTVDAHSIHSPFFFDFYCEVIKKENAEDSRYKEIEELRKKLLVNHTLLKITDLGAHSSHFKNEHRTIAQIAATSLSPSNYCRLLSRIVSYQHSKQIVELGTSMGLTTLYLSLPEDARITTFEGNSTMVNIALTHFEAFEKTNIKLIEGNIDHTLPDFLQLSEKIDFVFMDANHRYEPTLRYFNLLMKRMAPQGIIVMDDIYHSQEMTQAWNALREHKLVYGSVDLFKMGILFFDPALNHQHYTWSV